MVAVPSATPVTSPADETVATPVVDEVQATVAPDITLPPASRTVAVTVDVSGSVVKVKLVGDSVTEEATWVTVTEAFAFTDPDVAVIVAVPSAIDVTTPADETVATPVLEELQVIGASGITFPPAPPPSFTVAVTVTVLLR